MKGIGRAGREKQGNEIQGTGRESQQFDITENEV